VCHLKVKNILLKENIPKSAINKIRVEELPIGYWTEDFKQHIENLMEGDKTKKSKGYCERL